MIPIVEHFGYSPTDIVMLTDRPGGADEIQPTYNNIVGSRACVIVISRHSRNDHR